MSVVDLHPEDLIDKLEQGRLSALEQSRLDAHVATCAACRFELDVRLDFAADVARVHPAPVLVDEPAAPLMLREKALSGAPRRKRRPVLLLALAAALVGGVSLAALGSRVLLRAKEVPGTPALAAGIAVRRAVATPASPSSSEVAAPAQNLALNDLPAVSPVPSEPRLTADNVGKPGPSAPALFRAANEARRANKSARAVSLYRALQAQYPNSAEARLSYATLASLQLDRGDTRSALDGFDEYLSHGSHGSAPLVEEALVGRALALQKLDDRGAEIAAWQDILRRFPKSVHARLARTRLSALGEQ